MLLFHFIRVTRFAIVVAKWTTGLVPRISSSRAMLQEDR